ncbi:MAG: hypothetical protein JNK46_13720 [Methylobacteriaceae bacterium]|nr:hypothetical protein [Methylobacteriaceae bacterium]
MTTGEAIVTFLPLVALVILFVIVGQRQMKTYRQHVEQVNSVNARILEANERMLRTLEEIKALLQDRKA